MLFQWSNVLLLHLPYDSRLCFLSLDDAVSKILNLGILARSARSTSRWCLHVYKSQYKCMSSNNYPHLALTPCFTYQSCNIFFELVEFHFPKLSQANGGYIACVGNILGQGLEENIVNADLASQICHGPTYHVSIFPLLRWLGKDDTETIQRLLVVVYRYQFALACAKQAHVSQKIGFT